ncbi:hypothetical protein PVK06_016339 [Gossypium arboreum]|uniref:Uncharacterized protein n=1 Tax=Gossypium arboreum TaxID=29729 RepID=A0ABR0Q0I5_GOSAR|nr:hypothetical protein PVK06_016339 [Gossypium arboreum]
MSRVQTYRYQKVGSAFTQIARFRSLLEILQRIHHLLENLGSWTIEHSPRDFSKVVDYLAKIAIDTSFRLKLFADILKEVLPLSSTGQTSGNITQRVIM